MTRFEELLDPVRAQIELRESPVEELTRLAPVEMIGGYWQEVGTNWRAGTTLERTAP